MLVSHYNILTKSGSMELHVAEILIICPDFELQHFCFNLTFRLEAKFSNLLKFILLWCIETLKNLQFLKQISNRMKQTREYFQTSHK
jgi:hypothetical protein